MPALPTTIFVPDPKPLSVVAPFRRMRFPPEFVVVLNVQVPALVTRLVPPGTRDNPSGEFVAAAGLQMARKLRNKHVPANSLSVFNSFSCEAGWVAG